MRRDCAKWRPPPAPTLGSAAALPSPEPYDDVRARLLGLACVSLVVIALAPVDAPDTWAAACANASRGAATAPRFFVFFSSGFFRLNTIFFFAVLLRMLRVPKDMSWWVNHW